MRGSCFIAFVVLVILFTAAFGRLFCGWICPQTIFLEMVYRRIEYWLEGNGPRQRELARAIKRARHLALLQFTGDSLR